MATLGWVNQPVNFGATALRFQEFQPEQEGEAIMPNLLAISPGNENEDDLEQLGGGLWSVELPMFFDVYTEKSSLSVSIASDVKDLLTREKAIYLKDWTNPSSPVTLGDIIYFEQVTGPQQPPSAAVSSDFRRHWRVVKCMAHCYYTE